MSTPHSTMLANSSAVLTVQQVTSSPASCATSTTSRVEMIHVTRDAGALEVDGGLDLRGGAEVAEQRDGDIRRELLAHPEVVRIKRDELDDVPDPGVVDVADQLGHQLGDAFRRVTLDLDVVDRSEDLERVGESRDAGPGGPIGKRGSGVELTKLGGGEGVDLTAAIGGTVDGVVVNDDRDVVGAEVNVALCPAEAELGGAGEGSDGVLRGFVATAAMRGDQRTSIGVVHWAGLTGVVTAFLRCVGMAIVAAARPLGDYRRATSPLQL